MARASIKGSVLVKLVEDLQRLREAGRLADAELARSLESEDLELLEKGPSVASWYPMGCYERLTELLLCVEGGGSDDYLRGRGEAVAERLIEAGVYQQVASLEREIDDIDEYLRLTKRLATLVGAIFNFADTSVELDPEHPRRVRFQINGAHALPDVARIVMEGFFARLARERGFGHRWISERSEAGVVRFRMDRDLGS